MQIIERAGVFYLYRSVAQKRRTVEGAPAVEATPVLSGEGHVIAVPTRALAQRIILADEGDSDNPFLQLAMVAYDVSFSDILVSLRDYAHGEALCYRVSAPMVLVSRQRVAWDRWLDWAEAEHGLIFECGVGVMPLVAHTTTLTRLEALVGARDRFWQVGVHAATRLMGSIVLALALAEGAIEADEAHHCAFLDDFYQFEKWGHDSEAVARISAIGVEIKTLVRYFDALNDR